MGLWLRSVHTTVSASYGIPRKLLPIRRKHSREIKTSAEGILMHQGAVAAAHSLDRRRDPTLSAAALKPSPARPGPLQKNWDRVAETRLGPLFRISQSHPGASLLWPLPRPGCKPRRPSSLGSGSGPLMGGYRLSLQVAPLAVLAHLNTNQTRTHITSPSGD